MQTVEPNCPHMMISLSRSSEYVMQEKHTSGNGSYHMLAHARLIKRESYIAELRENKTNLALSIEYNQHAQHAPAPIGRVIWRNDKINIKHKQHIVGEAYRDLVDIHETV